jgi:predicted regulator of Ras-like GTPase activity (Roadblock/LC7/MglB family)
VGGISLGEIRRLKMDKYTEKLVNIAEEIEGVFDVAFVGYDGIIVCRHSKTSQIDMDMICAEFASVVKDIRTIDNALKDIIITFSGKLMVIKSMNDGFLCMAMSSDGNLGRARMIMNKLEGDFCG